MKRIRALRDLNIKGFAVVYNRVADVHDKVADDLENVGAVTTNTEMITEALLQNQDVINLVGDVPKKPAPATAPEAAKPAPAPADQKPAADAKTKAAE